jgi:hypothetical protein
VDAVGCTVPETVAAVVGLVLEEEEEVHALELVSSHSLTYNVLLCPLLDPLNHYPCYERPPIQQNLPSELKMTSIQLITITLPDRRTLQHTKSHIKLERMVTYIFHSHMQIPQLFEAKQSCSI